MTSGRIGPTALGVALGAVLSVVLLHAQSATTPAATGRLTGRVIDVETGQPIGGASVIVAIGAEAGSVMVSGPEGDARSRRSIVLGDEIEGPSAVRAGSDGRFARDGVPAGLVTVQATAHGYSLGSANQSGLLGARAMSFVPGSTPEVIVALRRLGSISGRVIDADGEPVVGVPVLAHWLATSTGGTPQYAVSTPAMTDDRGIFRIGSLGGHDYIVAVRVTDAEVDAPPDPRADFDQLLRRPERRAKWLVEWLIGGAAADTSGADIGSPRPTVVAVQKHFYPRGVTGASARVVNLDHPRDLEQVDLMLPPMRGVEISGVVWDPSGPVPRADVRVTRDGVDPVAGLDESLATAVTGNDGGFRFIGVPAGEYVLTVTRARTYGVPSTIPSQYLPLSSATPADGVSRPALHGRLRLSVSSTNLSGLVVPVHEGLRFAGRIVFDGAGPPSAEAVRAWWVASPIAVAFAGIGGAGSDTPVSSTLEFSSTPRPQGRYWLQPSGPSSTWELSAATGGGRDLLAAPLELNDRDVTDIVLTVTSKTSVLSGRVAVPEPRRGCVVVLLNAAVPATATIVAPGRRPRIVAAGEGGAYRFDRLLAGEYLLAAVDEADMRDVSDLEFIARVAALARRVTIGELDRQTIDLQVVRVPR